MNDKMPAQLQSLAGPYSQNLVDTVSWCLKLDPLERPQSVFALQRALRKGQWREEPLTRSKPVESWFESITGKFSRKRERVLSKNDTGISLPT